ncbi:MAG: polymer-forming cytoskeletal protein [Chloroflexota bacterium]|nr:polymer-forming cytoskeletal protein [Chloroflexota bacterium]
MFGKKDELTPNIEISPSAQRVTSVLGTGISWKGDLSGKGGVRIEGAFEGKIEIEGLIVVDKGGRLESETIRANTLIVAGTVRSNIIAQKVEIRSTGRIWGDVTTAAFSTEEGAFLRGKIQMEENVEINIQEDKKDEEQ